MGRDGIADLAVRAFQFAAEGQMLIGLYPQVQRSRPQAEGLLDRVDNPFSVFALEQEPIRHHMELSEPVFDDVVRKRVNGSVMKDPVKAHLQEVFVYLA